MWLCACVRCSLVWCSSCVEPVAVAERVSVSLRHARPFKVKHDQVLEGEVVILAKSATACDSPPSKPRFLSFRENLSFFARKRTCQRPATKEEACVRHRCRRRLKSVSLCVPPCASHWCHRRVCFAMACVAFVSRGLAFRQANKGLLLYTKKRWLSTAVQGRTVQARRLLWRQGVAEL